VGRSSLPLLTLSRTTPSISYLADPFHSYAHPGTLNFFSHPTRPPLCCMRGRSGRFARSAEGSESGREDRARVGVGRWEWMRCVRYLCF
jgi:hypothetical protein